MPKSDEYVSVNMNTSNVQAFLFSSQKGMGEKERGEKNELQYSPLPVLGQTAVGLLKFYPTISETSDLHGL